MGSRHMTMVGRSPGRGLKFFFGTNFSEICGASDLLETSIPQSRSTLQCFLAATEPTHGLIARFGSWGTAGHVDVTWLGPSRGQIGIQSLVITTD